MAKQERVMEVTFTITYKGTRKTGDKLFAKVADIIYEGLPKKYARNTFGSCHDMTQADWCASACEDEA